jgi:hypothetical protein
MVKLIRLHYQRLCFFILVKYVLRMFQIKLYFIIFQTVIMISFVSGHQYFGETGCQNSHLNHEVLTQCSYLMWTVQEWEFCHWLSLYNLINVDITAVYYMVFYFIYVLWVFRVLIWIVNWVSHVHCQTCDNVDWINGTGLNWRLFPLTTRLFNNWRLQGVTGQKTIIWTQHHENL